VQLSVVLNAAERFSSIGEKISEKFNAETLSKWATAAVPFSIENEVRSQADFSAWERLHPAPIGPLLSKLSKMICARFWKTKTSQ
jgi:hypothetical protein